VLSELPGAWTAALERAAELAAPLTTPIGDAVAPDRNEQLLLLQTLLGARPLGDEPTFGDRLAAFAVKAAREAKVHTSWIDPHERHEAALERFARGLAGPEGEPARRELEALAPAVEWGGALTSLAQLVLKLAAPGVPDLYQGTELWSLRLVDPDNRAPVDFERRAALLDELDAPDGPPLAELLARFRDGRVKLAVTRRGLALRRERHELLAQGDYVALAIEGPRARHACAFARRHEGRVVIAAVPRLVASLAPPGEPPVGPALWGDTALRLPPEAPARYRDVLADVELEARGGRLPLRDVFGALPFALLASA
jgi:(1->4)-alpha-D-glucan 1-alpha-D-glucosylmutase